MTMEWTGHWRQKAVLYNSRSACIDPEDKRSKLKVTLYKNGHVRTIASDHDWY